MECRLQEEENISEVDNRPKEENDEKKLLLASVFIKDACNGHFGIMYKTDEKSLKSYIAFNCLWVKVVLHFIIFFHLSLALFEPPAVEGLALPNWVTIIFEAICLVFYLSHILFAASFSETKLFWIDIKNITVMIVLCLITIDIVCYLGFYCNGVSVIRWSRPLRPLLLVNFLEFRQVRRALRNISRTMPDIMNVLILLFLAISLFSLMALKLFGNRNLTYRNGNAYFQNLVDSFFDLYVLVTAANNPDIMIPAYNAEKISALFFIIFITICVFIIMNIFLAVVYNNYRKNLKNEIKKSIYLKRNLLLKAYNLIKTTGNASDGVEKDAFSSLLKKIKPDRSGTYANILWQVLDPKGSNQIGKLEFMQLADLLNVEISEVKDRVTYLQMFFPKLYNSNPSRFIQSFVKAKYFRYLFDAVIVINAICIALNVTMAEWFFLSVFTLEIMLKLYTFGSREFFKKFWNVFDFVVIGTALVWSICDVVSEKSINGRSHLEFLMVLRVLRLVKIIGGIPRFRVIIRTIMHLGPSIITYGCVLMVFQYMFAIVGMELFGGLVKLDESLSEGNETFCGDLKLKDSDFWRSDYCNMNFNNILQSMVIMFELSVVNQWHVIASGYAKVTSSWARLYFMFYHIVCVVIVLNIFTAFVLEAFILEFNFSKRWQENILETKINELGLGLGSQPRQKKNIIVMDESPLVGDMDEDILDADHDSRQLYLSVPLPPGNYPDLSTDTDLRFHLSSGPKNVEDLLRRMFEDEISDHKEELENHPV
ncbi:two pore calcium channel protein 1-like [Ischnura elegans]|uniref:two pore calcium channel protein 1-like n=1 Tax=Ischnura elegans TaxID=197161 RepID=UPI001ED89196|nr:two pore calcium channel protein 1-like [Ischnura elegans]XP_046384152.1 two pore calcium channel protein 1-like [Ischnura elegans]